MPRYEYKHVRMTYGWGFFSKDKFEEKLMGVLEPLGEEGWELKSMMHEGMEQHCHLVFGRVKPDGDPDAEA